jgi:hypothetical protein
MPKATCLVNDTKKEYVIIYEYNVGIVGNYLEMLEIYRAWNLSSDNIFVRLIYDNEYYINVTAYLPPSNGGEIIYEYLHQEVLRKRTVVFIPGQ